jgi:hypothetical protein
LVSASSPGPCTKLLAYNGFLNLRNPWLGRCDDVLKDLRVEAGEVMGESMVCCESAATDDRPSSCWMSPDDDEDDDEAMVDGGMA